MKNNQVSKEELEKEKLRHEIKGLKRWWIQFILSLCGLLIILGTAFFTNLSEYLKVNKLEQKDTQLSKRLDSINICFKKTKDSVKTYKSYEIKFAETFKIKESLIVSRIKTKDELIIYYKNQLDSLTNLIIKSKSIKKAMSGFSNDFDKSFQHPTLVTNNGDTILTDDGKAIQLN